MIRRLCFLVLAVMVCGGSAHAAMTRGKSALVVHAGYVSGKSALSGDNIDGGVVSIEYQKMDWINPVTGGFSIGYAQIHESANSDSSQNTISSVPVLFGGKYWLGGGFLQGFVGVAFGMYFSQLEISTSSKVPPSSGSYSSETAMGIGLGFPLGVSLSIGDSIMLNAGYTLNWLWDNQFLDNDLLQTVNVGLGFSFGD